MLLEKKNVSQWKKFGEMLEKQVGFFSTGLIRAYIICNIQCVYNIFLKFCPIILLFFFTVHFWGLCFGENALGNGVLNFLNKNYRTEKRSTYLCKKNWHSWSDIFSDKRQLDLPQIIESFYHPHSERVLGDCTALANSAATGKQGSLILFSLKK